jgi:hypothetical protein
MCCVRSTSGIGIDSPEPNRYALETCLGIWSTLVAVYRFAEPSARTRTGL